VAAVDRAICVLSAFGEGPTPLSLSALSQRTQLYMSKVLRLMVSLEHVGLVQRLSDGGCVPGPAIARLQAAMADTPPAGRHPDAGHRATPQA
jgi:DNA-binding IclR family transcriptional regulator